MYGYRLFVVGVRKGNKHAAHDFGNLEGSPYLDLVHADVSNRLNENLKLEDPGPGGDDDQLGAPSGAVIRYTDAYRTDTTARMHFYHGNYGDGGILIDPEGIASDLNIEGRAVSNEYRAAIITPASGTRAILGVEARGRKCPSKRIVTSLRQLSKVPWKLVVQESVADAAAVRNFIRNGVVKDLAIVKYATARDGDSLAENLTLNMSIKGDSRLQQPLQAQALEWVSRSVQRLRGQPTDTAGIANELARIAIGYPINVEFDDSSVTIEGPSGRSKSLRPMTDVGEWIYDLGSTWPSDDAFFGELEETAQYLLPNLADE